MYYNNAIVCGNIPKYNLNKTVHKFVQQNGPIYANTTKIEKTKMNATLLYLINFRIYIKIYCIYQSRRLFLICRYILFFIFLCRIKIYKHNQRNNKCCQPQNRNSCEQKSIIDGGYFDTITEVASSVGYSDPLYFSRAFKKNTMFLRRFLI